MIAPQRGRSAPEHYGRCEWAGLRRWRARPSVGSSGRPLTTGPPGWDESGWAPGHWANDRDPLPLPSHLRDAPRGCSNEGAGGRAPRGSRGCGSRGARAARRLTQRATAPCPARASVCSPPGARRPRRGREKPWPVGAGARPALEPRRATWGRRGASRTAASGPALPQSVRAGDGVGDSRSAFSEVLGLAGLACSLFRCHLLT